MGDLGVRLNDAKFGFGHISGGDVDLYLSSTSHWRWASKPRWVIHALPIFTYRPHDPA